MKIIFFGSDDFAAVHLQHLLSACEQVLCCVTGPDKPQGRGMKVASSPIKQIASDKGIPCLQPATLKDKNTIDALRAHDADVFVVVAYGRLLTQEVLDIPKMLCMNVHGSLLPYYRGAAPINWAILNGDKETGVTLQKMALGLDCGEIMAQQKMDIKQDEDSAQLRQRMAEIGAQLLVKTLKKYPSGQFPLVPQDESKVTWAPKLTKEMGKIDWKKPARSIADQIRGLQPWPGAYTFYNGKVLKILRAGISKEDSSQMPPGQVMAINKEGIQVACADQPIVIQELQPEAGRPMPARSFAAGYRIAPGILL